MIFLKTIISQFETPLRQHYRLTPEQSRALLAMKVCRTQTSLQMELACESCDHQRRIPHSCGHRHCPHCQHHESQRWLERQTQRLVPADYFLITFTLPKELRALARKHPKLLYDVIMRCSWDTIHQFSLNDKQLKGTPGAIAVLHTHTRQLAYHPHVHLVVPAAAIDAKEKLWRCKQAKKGQYLFNHKALAKVFRAKLLHEIEAAQLSLPNRYPQDWVVDCKHVGSGEKALIYLGRYLYRGGISEKQIVACEKGQVTFRFTNSKTKKTEYRTLSGEKFLWRLLQHVLPKGFRRARNFGFLHPNRKRLISLVQRLLNRLPKPFVPAPRAPILCPCCQSAMVIVRTRIRNPLTRLSTAPPSTRGVV